MFRDDVARLFANMDKKKLPLLGVGIFAITSLTGCPTETKSQPKNCTCPEKAHLNEGENCKCGADICSDCTEKINTNLSNGTKVIKEVGVSKADFDAMVATLNLILTEVLDPDQLLVFPNKITEIYVTMAEAGMNIQGTMLSIGCDEDIQSVLRYLLNNVLAQLKQSNEYRLVNEYKKNKNDITRGGGAWVSGTRRRLCVI